MGVVWAVRSKQMQTIFACFLAFYCAPLAADYTKTKISNPDVGPVVGSVVGMVYDGERLFAACSNAVLLFRPNEDGAWEREAAILPPDIPPRSYGFSSAFAISEGTVFAGSPLTPAGSANTGALLVYTFLNGHWTLLQELVASDAGELDRFGSSLSVDGQTLVVGAPRHDSRGSVYVFRKVEGTWVEVQKLDAPDAQVDQYFGTSVLVAGDSIIVGAPYDDDNGFEDSGSVYIFQDQGEGKWAFERKLFPSVSSRYGDKFGQSLSLSGDSLLIGCGIGMSMLPLQVPAYVFVRTTEGWVEQARILSPEMALYEFGDISGFGDKVTIFGDKALIAARGWRTQEGRVGAAFLYERNDGAWTETRRFLAADGADRDEFGMAITLTPEKIFASTPPHLDGDFGAIYEFNRSGDEWDDGGKIDTSNDAVEDSFGWSVGLSGDTMIVGAGRDEFPGSARIYRNTLGRWEAEQSLRYPGTTPNADFRIVAIDGDTAAVGASNDGEAGQSAGAVFMFERTPEGWVQTQELIASDAAALQFFGGAIAISGDTMVVGAPMTSRTQSAGPGRGGAYVFQRNNGVWTEVEKFVPIGGQDGDTFGSCVDVSENYVIVGAPGYVDENEPADGAGAAYLYARRGGGWEYVQILRGRASSVAIQGDTAVVATAAGAEAYSLTNGTWSFNQSLSAPTEDYLHRAVDIDGDRIVICASESAGGGVWGGLAVVYRRMGTSWIETGAFHPDVINSYDSFGFSVSMSGKTIVIGARSDFAPEFLAGSVYIFQEVDEGTSWIVR